MDNKINLSVFLKVLILVLAIPVLFSQLLIRYVYTDWLEPESTAGIIMLADSVVARQLDPTKKNILILGNSRIGEGVSAKIANATIKDTDYHFVVLGLPGTTPRIWSYVLDKIDKNSNRFYAVYLMAENYNDTAEENYNDRDLDSSYLSGLLSLSNLSGYPSSFDDSKKVDKAIRSILFPISLLQKDMIQFIAHPKKRIKKVLLWRKDYFAWTYDYGGNEVSLPELDTIENAPTVLNQLSAAQKPGLEWYFGSVKYCNKTYPHSFRYNSRWFGEIAQHYSASAVRVGAFMIPRGPYHNMMGCDTAIAGSFEALHKKGLLELVPNQISFDLERPANFFDHLHLNGVGRKAFSEKLASSIVEQLDN